MGKPKKSAAEYRAELEEAKQAVDRLRERVESLTEQLKRAEKELLDLTGRGGFHRSYGKIGRIKDSLLAAERWEADAAKPPVVWIKEPYYRGDVPWVVSRVTPKRIFVRQQGADREEQYQRDGTRPGSYKDSQIDVAATLGVSSE